MRLLYAFDLLEFDGEDLRPTAPERAQGEAGDAAARAPAGVAFNEHTDEDSG